MSKKNEVKVGDRVVMNLSYSMKGVHKGEIGKVKRLPRPGSLIYKVKFKGRPAIGMFGYRFDLLLPTPPSLPEEKEPEPDIKVGSPVVLNETYATRNGFIKKGATGTVVSIDKYSNGDVCLVRFEHAEVCLFRHLLDLVWPEPQSPTKPDKDPAKKGIRITGREVKPDLFEIVDFTALEYGLLPPEYIDSYPHVSVVSNQLCITEAKDCANWFGRGDLLTRVRFDELVKTCKEAGERLLIINNYPKKAFEIVI